MAFAVSRGTITGTTEVNLGTPPANSNYVVKNLGPDSVMYIGPTGVTPANGFPIEPKCSITVPGGAGSEPIFGCTVAGFKVQYAILTDV